MPKPTALGNKVERESRKEGQGVKNDREGEKAGERTMNKRKGEKKKDFSTGKTRPWKSCSRMKMSMKMSADAKLVHLDQLVQIRHSLSIMLCQQTSNQIKG